MPNTILLWPRTPSTRTIAAPCQLLQEKLKVKVLEKAEKKPFLPKCPCCKTGNLHRIAVFDQRGPPAWYLGGSQSSNSCKN
jgi:hypothetical protein